MSKPFLATAEVETFGTLGCLGYRQGDSRLSSSDVTMYFILDLDGENAHMVDEATVLGDYHPVELHGSIHTRFLICARLPADVKSLETATEGIASLLFLRLDLAVQRQLEEEEAAETQPAMVPDPEDEDRKPPRTKGRVVVRRLYPSQRGFRV